MPPQHAQALEALRRVQDGFAIREDAPDGSIARELDRAISILNQAGGVSPDRLRRRSSRIDSLQQIEEQCGRLDEDGEIGWGGMVQEDLARTQRSTALQRGKLASAQIAAAITAGDLCAPPRSPGPAPLPPLHSSPSPQSRAAGTRLSWSGCKRSRRRWAHTTTSRGRGRAASGGRAALVAWRARVGSRQRRAHTRGRGRRPPGRLCGFCLPLGQLGHGSGLTELHPCARGRRPGACSSELERRGRGPL